MPKAKPKTKQKAAPLPPRTRTQTPKAKAAAKKKKRGGDESSDDSVDELEEEEEEDGVLGINWKADPALSETLLALICEHTEIKRSLYPPCGPNASSTQGGGKPKTAAQWELCVLLVGQLPKYKESIAAATDMPSTKLAYGNKIKNRLSAMAKTCRRYNAEMGETGAGIDNASQIDMTKPNSFTTKWAQISAHCPWYFEMRNLIGQRPNLVPTGLGHSGSAVAAGVIIPPAAPPPPAAATDDDDNTSNPIDGWSDSPSPRGSPQPTASKRKYRLTFDDDGAGITSADDYIPSSPVPSESAGGVPAAIEDEGPEEKKHVPVVVVDEEEEEEEEEDEDVDVEVVKKEKKSGVPKQQKGKTPKPSTSAPAIPTPAVAPRPSKKAKITEFSEIAKSEEKTRQREIELAALRTRHQIKTTEAKGRFLELREERRAKKDEGKQQERLLKLRMKEQRMQNQHELRMATARGAGNLSSSSHGGDSFFDTHSLSSGSHYAPSEPTDDYADFNSFSSNALAGPSTSSAADGTTDFADLREFASMATAGKFM
ncbi:hypothetical protein C8R46DRAFT_1347809 [Mycena filopes]|nr:hypothetical protein C8R46DRAFT_1347809 [Mycena filopes]